jgi:two-component system, OmpR family, phosphate regulon sensor histidine kinase PhoR
MKLTMRWKLLLSHLLVVFIMGGALYGWLSTRLGDYMVEETRAGLLSEARLARLTSSREIRYLRRDAPALATAIARETRARVTFISPEGEVLGDSDVGPGELKEMENHLGRPEVQQALKSGQGSAIRYSSTIRTPMLYVALPFQSAAGEKGVLRLALQLSSLQQTRESLRAIVAFALAATMLISLLLSFILSNVTSRSLRAMARIAAQIGNGEFGRRVPVMGRDEVGELAVVMNDMAARIEGELKSVAAEKNRLDTILRGMGEGVMVTDARGVITLVNPAFRNLFDLREDVEGKPLMDITRHPSLHEASKKLIGTKTEHLEEFALPLNGGKTVLTHWVPLLENESLQGVVAVFHDISDLKRLEKIRRDFVANVSHELRTPVTVIKGYAETLLDGALATDPERAAVFLEKIHCHAGRLASLIGDLLILSELESGVTPPEASPVAIGPVVDHACAMLEEKALSKKISIVQPAGRESGQVMAERAKLEQVLVNLLDNAIKYTPENGSITISSTESDGMLTIAVSDTGIGIPDKDLPRIFERFYRVDAARSREQGGTGLGLAIVKHIVQLYGGSVSVESRPGKGSTFSFTLKRPEGN